MRRLLGITGSSYFHLKRMHACKIYRINVHMVSVVLCFAVSSILRIISRFTRCIYPQQNNVYSLNPSRIVGIPGFVMVWLLPILIMSDIEHRTVWNEIYIALPTTVITIHAINFAISLKYNYLIFAMTIINFFEMNQYCSSKTPILSKAWGLPILSNDWGHINSFHWYLR